jgi:uncharacterized SAM-binding protein YcdF (DUF218 family)
MKKAIKIAAGIVALILAYPLWVGIQVWQQSRTDEVHAADAIVVLGAAQYNGEPSPVFQARLDHAAYLYLEDLSPTIIVTGGKQPGDTFTEAEAGENYLAAQGISRDDILGETEGSTTYESLEAVTEIAAENDIDSLLLVSDPMHSERVKRMAHDLGFHESWVSWAGYTALDRSRLTKAKELVREVASIMVYEFMDR